MKRLMSWVVIGVMLGGLTLAGVAAAEPLKIRYSVWVGYGPLFLAREKGFLKEEKVDVELINMEDPKEGFFPGHLRTHALAVEQVKVFYRKEGDRLLALRMEHAED